VKELYNFISYKHSEIITKKYSTSFSIAISFLSKSIRKHIYAIYGLVRIADEIVDTMLDVDRFIWLKELQEQTYKALESKFSTNPILNAFQLTANRFSIGSELIEPFFNSMYIDLKKNKHDEHSYKQYIYGSAEVIGLMCLKIFVNGDEKLYKELEEHARALGSAFQKVNFLRDIKNDFKILNRTYFPDVDLTNLTEDDKIKIINDIKADFKKAWIGIIKLPRRARIGVMVAYEYYLALLNKIKKSPVDQILKQRIRINNFYKIILLLKILFKSLFIK